MSSSHSSKVVSISGLKVACKNCNLRELCLPLGLNADDMDELEGLIQQRRTVKKGEALYRHGDPLRSLYAVRRGMFKTAGLTEDGRVHVTGFYLPGELLGFDAITADRHPCTAEAIETSDVCEIPYNKLEEMAQHVPGLQHQLLKVMSREIVRDEQLLVLLGRMTAEERLASCLLSFSRRQARLGLSERDLNLAMSRQDLGHYLGLALETVSRLFSRFQEEGLIEVIGRQVRIHRIDRLQSIAGAAPPADPQSEHG